MGKEKKDPNYLPKMKKEPKEPKVDPGDYRRLSDRKRKAPNYLGVKEESDTDANESADEIRKLESTKLALDHIKTESYNHGIKKRKSESHEVGVRYVDNEDTLLISAKGCPTVKKAEKPTTAIHYLKCSIPLSSHSAEGCLIVKGSKYDNRFELLQKTKYGRIAELERKLAAAESANAKLTEQNKSLQQVRKGKGRQFTFADLLVQNEQFRCALQEMNDAVTRLHDQKCGSRTCIFDSSKDDVQLQVQVQELTAANQVLFQSLSDITESKGHYKVLAWMLLGIIKHGTNFNGDRSELMKKIVAGIGKERFAYQTRTDQNKEWQKLMTDLAEIDLSILDCNANEEPATEGEWGIINEKLSELYAQLCGESTSA